MTSHHVCHILFIRSKSLGAAYIQGWGVLHKPGRWAHTQDSRGQNWDLTSPPVSDCGICATNPTHHTHTMILHIQIYTHIHRHSHKTYTKPHTRGCTHTHSYTPLGQALSPSLTMCRSEAEPLCSLFISLKQRFIRTMDE